MVDPIKKKQPIALRHPVRKISSNGLFGTHSLDRSDLSLYLSRDKTNHSKILNHRLANFKKLPLRGKVYETAMETFSKSHPPIPKSSEKTGFLKILWKVIDRLGFSNKQ